MSIGQLNDRARIEYPEVSGQDSFGSDIIAWKLLAVVYCSLQDEMPGREAIAQGTVVTAKRVRMRTRHRTDITSAMRVIVNRPTPEIYQIIEPPILLGNKDGVQLRLEKLSTENSNG